MDPAPIRRQLAGVRALVFSVVAFAGVALVSARAAGAEEPDRGAETWRDAGITAAALAATGALALETRILVPDRCRICEPDRLDAAAHDALLWRHPGIARLASDLSANGLVPLLAAGDAFRANRSAAGAGHDLLLVAEAAALTTMTTEIAKDAFGRRRPDAPVIVSEGSARNQSFWSGHTALAFSVVVAEATQDTLRGDPAAPWVWGIGLTLASGVGYLRVAGDAHWVTDVLAGAAAGSAAGALVPLLSRRLPGGVTISPAPGGIAMRW